MQRSSSGLALAAALLGLGNTSQAQVVLHDIDGGTGIDRLGAAVDAAGDVNNDGIADFVVGAPQNGAVFGGGVGYVRVYSGSNGAVLHNFVGTNSTQLFGYSVAGVGDVNNDNYDDIAVGTPYYDHLTGFSQGRVQVFSGQTGAVIYTFYGMADGEQMGWSVAGVGDVNMDGTPDIAGTAYLADVPVFNAGTIRVWSGLNGSVLHTFNGLGSNDHFGVALAAAGDFDNDGRADVIAGGTAGAVRIFSGQTGAVLKVFPAPGSTDSWGLSLGVVGDVTGDGILDYIIGAPQSSPFGSPGSGYARVLNGATGATVRQFSGDFQGESFGHSVSSAGDFNGDSVIDYIVGAPAVGDVNRPGYARLFDGATGQVMYQFDAETNVSNLGSIVRLIGDLNGDGAQDVLVAEPDAPTPGTFSGSVKVYAGSTPVCLAPTNYCVSFNNSTGLAATIGYTGSNSVAANDLVLTASQCPPGQIGVFFYGNAQVVQLLGSGLRCVGGSIYRLQPTLAINGSGVATRALDLNALTGPGIIQSGSVWNFQFWFRDPMDGNAGMNLSNGLKVPFCP